MLCEIKKNCPTLNIKQLTFKKHNVPLIIFRYTFGRLKISKLISSPCYSLKDFIRDKRQYLTVTSIQPKPTRLQTTRQIVKVDFNDTTDFSVK